MIDALLEETLRQVERNDFKESQRRVTMAKFWGEAYNFKLINSDTLFGLLYRMMNWDWESEKEDEWWKKHDREWDCFRLRLICTTLESLGKFFQFGPRRTMMDRFLVFFQRFIHTRTYVLMDLEFMILDTLDALRPHFPKFHTTSDAEDACQKILEIETALGCHISDRESWFTHYEEVQKVISALGKDDSEEEPYYGEEDDGYYDQQEQPVILKEEAKRQALEEQERLDRLRFE
eukprot:CAMPEP_0202979256 /NCGR_PEP_ID=MMETSP1396-20130829/85458_1 /ASSEMBLY_ACC=CAM_ASM_000872 /TAXON_ID= /ORGANISM="Pseudokeronopsis sp., Strain Brazil" /LENGTH=233 /DNA_ID=CAMNT_0049718603 /DNA_START=516 /DNA_END=1217 /DNA_ORIENTATION=-